MDPEQQLELLMEIIAYAGEAKSMAIEAMSMARTGGMIDARDQVRAAEKAANKAHSLHSDLLACEANSADFRVTMLTVHAADHLAEAGIAIDMVREIIELYAQIDQLRKEK